MIINKNNVLTYLDILSESQNKKEIFKYILRRLAGKKVLFDEDVFIKSRGILFNCGKIMENCTVACSTFEKNMFEDIKFKPGVFIDIGAHIGKHSLFIAKKYGSQVQVVSIEASPETFKLLNDNIRINNLNNIKTFNVACSNKVGTIDFWKSDFHPATNSTSKINNAKKITVPTRTIDSIIKINDKVSAIKMDVEGAELEVLEGAKNTIKKNLPLIFFEAWDSERYSSIAKVLSSYGYKTKRIDEYNYLATIN